MRLSLSIELGERSYPIHIGEGLLREPATFAPFRDRNAQVVTDESVAAHHLAPVLSGLGLSDADVLILPPGEAQKNWASVERILDWLLARRTARDGLLVALGGGVVGDMTGFAAAIYQRGIDFIQIPTTLLAQVDSSVGGKTGINHPRGKNMIGAFHQPRAVIADIAVLRTLPPRELGAGLAEVIKYGMLGDATFFVWLERHLDRLLALEAGALAEAVRRSCEIKARIVGQDERERVSGGPRALLNLGHTFGHAIETHTGYTQWLHGEAVAAGLCMAADLSARLGWLPDADAARCLHLVRRAGLPTRPPAGMQPDDFRRWMSHDKKVAAGQLRLVLMRAIGSAVLTAQFDGAALDATLAHFTAAEA
jgi:3-dehydroquinate synthase